MNTNDPEFQQVYTDWHQHLDTIYTFIDSIRDRSQSDSMIIRDLLGLFTLFEEGVGLLDRITNLPTGSNNQMSVTQAQHEMNQIRQQLEQLKDMRVKFVQ